MLRLPIYIPPGKNPIEIDEKAEIKLESLSLCKFVNESKPGDVFYYINIKTIPNLYSKLKEYIKKENF